MSDPQSTATSSSGQFLDAQGVLRLGLSDEELISLARNILKERLGDAPELNDPQVLAGSGTARVLRVKASPNPMLENRSLVIKHVPLTGDIFDDAALVREIVSYQFTNTLTQENRPGPVLLAYDAHARILIVSDLGDGATFADAFQEADPARRVVLLRMLGRTLGRMHASTADREEHFQILFSRFLAKHPATREVHSRRDAAIVASVDSGEKLLQALDVPVPAVMSEKLTQAMKLLGSSQLRAFSPFDLSPDNIIVAQDTYLLDYEWAGYRDAAFDVASVIAGFPQFLMATPLSTEEAEIFLDAWADQAGSVWPEVLDRDWLHRHVLNALLCWAVASLAYVTYGSMQASYAARQADPTQPGRTQLQDHLSADARADLWETYHTLEWLARRVAEPDWDSIADVAAQLCAKLQPSQTH